MIRKVIFQILVALLTAEILVRKLATLSINLLAKFSPTQLRKRFRTGSLVSRILRLLFEYKNIRVVFGANIAAGVLTIGALGTPLDETLGSANPQVGVTEIILAQEEPVMTTNEVGFQIPTTQLIGLSTRFNYGHPGIDLRAPLGSEIKPLGNGVVKTIIHSNYGYGRRVIIEHEDGMSSLYAHMGLITVDEGETVNHNTKLGEVGLTGWTTGPHLHLELYKNGVPVNPLGYLII